MKQQPNYGFPLSSVLIRFLFALFIPLFIAILISLNVNLFLIILITVSIVLAYVFFGIILFKKRFLDYRMNILKKMIKIADLKGNEKILDIGTGAGFLAIGFAKNLKDGKVTGLDKYSIKYDSYKTQLISHLKINFIGHTLKNAKRNAKIENVEDKCEFIQTDITKPLKFSDGYFDIIISSQFLYCLPPQKRLPVFHEINRILKNDGKIIFFESKGFLGWNINHSKNYFEKIGYHIDIIKTKEFRRTCILSGKKL